MKVYFIGAGPGDPDLLTIAGQKVIAQAPMCLYAGSLVPDTIIKQAQNASMIIDTAPLNLEEIVNYFEKAKQNDWDVARIHSGDVSLYGAIAEQIVELKKRNIEYKIIPGVSSVSATAARLGQELTLPDICQSIILTRTSMQSSAMPEGETLENFAKTGALLAIHLSIRNTEYIMRELIPYYGENCPVVIASRVGWSDEMIVKGHLCELRKIARQYKLTRTVLILIGPSLAEEQKFNTSALYDKEHVHILRPRRKT